MIKTPETKQNCSNHHISSKQINMDCNLIFPNRKKRKKKRSSSNGYFEVILKYLRHLIHLVHLVHLVHLINLVHLIHLIILSKRQFEPGKNFLSLGKYIVIWKFRIWSHIFAKKSNTLDVCASAKIFVPP